MLPRQTPDLPLPLATARRLWRAFALGRCMTALVLLAVLAMHQWRQPLSGTEERAMVLLAVLYAAVAFWVWSLRSATPPRLHWPWRWQALLALDIACITALHLPQQEEHPLLPLLALPLLCAASLGTLRLTLTTAFAVVAVVMSSWLWQLQIHDLQATAQRSLTLFMMLTGFGALAYLTHLLAQRLAWQAYTTQHSQREKQTLGEVNQLLVAKLSEGIIVLDSAYRLHMANPSARSLLGCAEPVLLPVYLTQVPAWSPLCDVVDECLQLGLSPAQPMLLPPVGHDPAPVQLYVRAWRVNPPQADETDLLFTTRTSHLLPDVTPMCVVFLEDMRAIEARLRTEKMAAMGRISAAVAHEIRNPLAAIVQANALLAEDLHDPVQQRLSHMVQTNAQRLAQTVDDVLDIARVQPPNGPAAQHSPVPLIALDDTLADIWHDWQAQDSAQRCTVFAPDSHQCVPFAPEHLRRITINLLDNALRHRVPPPEHPHYGVQLHTGVHQGQAWMQVWSAGPAIEAGIQAHLFEPFFSSLSRSTGLGLYLCRQLCLRHGAHIHYQRLQRHTPSGPIQGNAFTVVFAHTQPRAENTAAAVPDTAVT